MTTPARLRAQGQQSSNTDPGHSVSRGARQQRRTSPLAFASVPRLAASQRRKQKNKDQKKDREYHHHHQRRRWARRIACSETVEETTMTPTQGQTPQYQMTTTKTQTPQYQTMTTRTFLFSPANTLQPCSSQTCDRCPRAPLGALVHQHLLQLEVLFEDHGVCSCTLTEQRALVAGKREFNFYSISQPPTHSQLTPADLHSKSSTCWTAT